MSMLLMDRWVYENIVDAAVADRPKEMCGLLTYGNPIGRAEFWRTENVSERPLDSFLIDPVIQKALTDAGAEIVGMVHSHPNGEPAPSDLDRETYVPEGYWYLVVGRDGEVGVYRCVDGELVEGVLDVV